MYNDVRQDLESADSAEFQSFDLTSYTGEYATRIGVVMQGTGSGAPGFSLLDAIVLGTQIENPTDTFYVRCFLRAETAGDARRWRRAVLRGV